MQKQIVNSAGYKRRRALCALLVCMALGGMTLLAAARTQSINLTINNNSQREIRHVYLAVGDPNNWGPDQLGGAAISSGGGSFTLNNVSCNASSIRVISEDADGCFLYKTVSCGDHATWDITNSDVPDCGN